MQIRFLAYADDIALLCSTPEALQKMFLLEAISSSIGMKLNYGKGKTECFSVNGAPFVLKNGLGAQIPQISRYKYLGSYVHFVTQTPKLIASNRTISRFLKSYVIGYQSRVRIFQSVTVTLGSCFP